MNKIRNLMTKMSGEVKELGKKFPLTMLLIFIVTMIFTMEPDFTGQMKTELEKIALFCTIWAVGTFFTEIWFAKKTNKIISYTITGGISLIFTQMIASDKMQKMANLEIIFRFLWGYILILVLLSIYQSIQKENLKFETYLLKVFRGLFNTTATYIILNIGVVILTAIFVQLILDGHYGTILGRIFTLLFGLFYVPSMVYTFSGISSKEVNSFIKGLVLYVLLPLTTIAMAIIYLYIAKIILLRDMPQNVIYRILAGIFIVGFPVWNAAKNDGQDKKWVAKITTILPYLYTPFILLEIYSIGTRINEFGMTPMRYISCIFIVFQVIALALTFYRKGEKISQLCLYAAVLVLIVFVTPLNYQTVSNWSQAGRIKKMMPENTNFAELPDETKVRVKSAYRFLKNTPNGEKWLPSYLTDENKQKMEEYEKKQDSDYPQYVSLNCPLELDIQEYSKIIYVEGNNKEDEKAIVTLDKIGKTIDLTDKIDEIIQKNKQYQVDLDEEFQENHILKISETEEIYLAKLVISYYRNSGKLNYLRVEGYILER